jgi:hypothetical protein
MISSVFRGSCDPLSSLIASTASNEAITATAGPSTPAVSHVGVIPGGGLVSTTQRRQGVWPGTIVIVCPSLPITPPKIHGLPSLTAASLIR